jgi:hypothetical protein
MLAREGVPKHAVVARLGTSRPTLLLRRSQFQARGVPGLLKHAPGLGRRKTVGRNSDHCHTF